MRTPRFNGRFSLVRITFPLAAIHHNPWNPWPQTPRYSVKRTKTYAQKWTIDINLNSLYRQLCDSAHLLNRSFNKKTAEITGEKVNRGGYELEVPCIYHLYAPKAYVETTKTMLSDDPKKGHGLLAGQRIQEPNWKDVPNNPSTLLTTDQLADPLVWEAGTLTMTMKKRNDLQLKMKH